MSITYTNPVWAGSFADPFVLRYQGTYYAYGTGPRTASDRIFPVLTSPDLVHWTPAGGAMQPLAHQEDSYYWAPEVAERDGRFFLYYSVADSTSSDETHRLRVAVSESPTGPFMDSGNLLMPEEGFTIDAHPFRDPADGRWYLFFARDYFDQRAGTALAVAPLAEDMISLAGPAITVLRASADWQVYERDREIYGRRFAAWHTLEGAFIVPHAGLYYCFYSGGNWQTPDYGVGYAVADRILGPYREPETGPVVLRGVSGHVLGPGHNSVVLGPDEQTEFLVYHAWDLDRTARRLCIDPLRWSPEGPRCAGPTWTPQTIG
jgi:beta-xylosidase